MAVYKTVSSSSIIAKVYRDFKPSHTSWIGDANEWIGEALEWINATSIMQPYAFKCQVKEYRTKLPCNMDNLLGIEYNGARLKRSGATRDLSHKVIDAPIHEVESYKLSPNYINPTFEEGEIIIYCLAIGRDENGYVQIPDHVKFKEAISWYVIMKMLSSGYKHQVFDYPTAYGMWEKLYPQARNKAIAPDVDGYELFKNGWSNLILDVDKYKKFFNPDLAISLINSENPGTKIINDLTIIR